MLMMKNMRLLIATLLLLLPLLISACGSVATPVPGEDELHSEEEAHSEETTEEETPEEDAESIESVEAEDETDAETTSEAEADVAIASTELQPIEVITATPLPTEAPTELPAVIVPTDVPTEIPPTVVPTEVPPTIAPTELPPTDVPPTVAPTQVPPTEAPAEEAAAEEVEPTEAADAEAAEAEVAATPYTMTEEDAQIVQLVQFFGDPVNGEALFAQQYDTALGPWMCTQCHLVDSEQMLIGPGMLNLVDRAGERIPGMAAELYIYNSIIAPNDYIVPTYPGNVMPGNYAELLSEQDLYDISAYLLSLEG